MAMKASEAEIVGVWTGGVVAKRMSNCSWVSTRRAVFLRFHVCIGASGSRCGLARQRRWAMGFARNLFVIQA